MYKLAIFDRNSETVQDIGSGKHYRNPYPMSDIGSRLLLINIHLSGNTLCSALLKLLKSFMLNE